MKLADNVLEDLWFAEDTVGADASEAASKSLATKLAQSEGLKTFPAVAQKILKIFADVNYRVSEVTRALEEDPSMASGVLRMANSAFFAPRQPITQIDNAFVRIGPKNVKEIVCAISTMGLFKNLTPLGLVIRDHCAATAAIAQFVDRQFGLNSSDGLFLAGLLHDMGKMMLIESEEISYPNEDSDKMYPPETHHLFEREKLGYDHAVLAAHIVEGWNFGEDVSRMIAWHHQLARGFDTPKLGRKVAIISLANKIDHLLTDHPAVEDGSQPAAERLISHVHGAQECDFLGISEEALQVVWTQIYTVRNEALTVFSGVV